MAYQQQNNTQATNTATTSRRAFASAANGKADNGWKPSAALIKRYKDINAKCPDFFSAIYKLTWIDIPGLIPQLEIPSVSGNPAQPDKKISPDYGREVLEALAWSQFTAPLRVDTKDTGLDTPTAGVKAMVHSRPEGGYSVSFDFTPVYRIPKVDDTGATVMNPKTGKVEYSYDYNPIGLGERIPFQIGHNGIRVHLSEKQVDELALIGQTYYYPSWEDVSENSPVSLRRALYLYLKDEQVANILGHLDENEKKVLLDLVPAGYKNPEKEAAVLHCLSACKERFNRVQDAAAKGSVADSNDLLLFIDGILNPENAKDGPVRKMLNEAVANNILVLHPYKYNQHAILTSSVASQKITLNKFEDTIPLFVPNREGKLEKVDGFQLGPKEKGALASGRYVFLSNGHGDPVPVVYSPSEHYIKVVSRGKIEKLQEREKNRKAKGPVQKATTQQSQQAGQAQGAGLGK